MCIVLPKYTCKGQIPHQLMLKQIPTLRYLRRSGCVAQQTRPKNVDKFSVRAQQKFFVVLTSTGALLLNIASGLIKPALNVVFTESKIYEHFFGWGGGGGVLANPDIT